jgi:hypothetical protein
LVGARTKQHFVYVEQGRKGGKREKDLPALGVSLVGDARKNY